ncbi:MAG: alpha/beta fold hydrolase [Chloroflexota bacterium]
MSERVQPRENEVLEIKVSATDGFQLSATRYGDEQADTVLLINSATAVPQRFYHHTAEFFAEKGWQVITYDYRGIGGSRPNSLRGFEARMQDWGVLDMAGMVDWIAQALHPRRVFMLSHSVGGQLTGMLTNADQIDGMVTVSSQSGYWGVQGGSEKLKTRIIVTVVMPLLSRIYGYFPWSTFSSGEDLPAGVALQWAKWCRSRNYLLDDKTLPLERYADFTTPILAYSIDDDNWGTAQSVNEMMSAYPNVTREHVVLAEHGINHLGHMGYFRPKSRPLWELAYNWFERLT